MSFVRSHGLVRYFFYSGLIGIVAMIFMAALIWASYDSVSHWMLSLVPWDIGTVTDVISIVFMSASFFVVFKYIVLILSAPLMSYLSEKVEKIISEDYHDRGMSLGVILGDFLRGTRIALRNILREMLLTILLLVASLFAPFAVVTTPAIYLIQAYFAGFGNFDFWAERHFTYKGTIDFMKDHRPMVTGNGVPYIFLLAIPVIGVFLAPPLATIAATLQGHDKKINLGDLH